MGWSAMLWAAVSESVQALATALETTLDPSLLEMVLLLEAGWGRR